jgi:hypothetical protein
MITIVSYYESLSPLLFQNNFDIVFNILSLVESMGEEYIKPSYEILIKNSLVNFLKLVVNYDVLTSSQ